MSKSKGNVIDPLHVMEKYGTDSLRFTLASMSTPGRDIKLAEERIEGYRNFANKIWNAARFLLMNIERNHKSGGESARRTLPDMWVVSRLAKTAESVSDALETYRFDHACHLLYQFVWHEYCDWYLEMAKVSLQDPASAPGARQTLVESFEKLMRLLHPFMPFLTEELWQAIPHDGDSVMIAPFPNAELPSDITNTQALGAEQSMEALQRAISLLRTGRSLLNLPSSHNLDFYLDSVTGSERYSFRAGNLYLDALGKGKAHLAEKGTWPTRRMLILARQGMTIGIPVGEEIDLQKARERIEKQQAEETREKSRLETKLNNKEFMDKAPDEVKLDHLQRKAAIQQNLEILGSSLEQLKAMS